MPLVVARSITLHIQYVNIIIQLISFDAANRIAPMSRRVVFSGAGVDVPNARWRRNANGQSKCVDHLGDPAAGSNLRLSSR
jgi:hypothetical protein